MRNSFDRTEQLILTQGIKLSPAQFAAIGTIRWARHQRSQGINSRTGYALLKLGIAERVTTIGSRGGVRKHWQLSEFGATIDARISDATEYCVTYVQLIDVGLTPAEAHAIIIKPWSIADQILTAREIVEARRIVANNVAFRELAQLAASKISEARAARAARDGRPAPEPTKVEDLTIIPRGAFTPTTYVRVFDETSDTEVYDNPMALDSLIVRESDEYARAVNELERSRRYWWRNDAGELRYLTPAR